MHSRLNTIGLFEGFSKNLNYTKLGNSNRFTIGKILLNGSPEWLINTIVIISFMTSRLTNYSKILDQLSVFYHFTSLLFTTKFPENSWYSFYRPRKEERLSQPWSHPVVLNMESLDWESSTLITRPSLHKMYSHSKCEKNIDNASFFTFFHKIGPNLAQILPKDHTNFVRFFCWIFVISKAVNL